MPLPHPPLVIPVFIPHRGCPHQCAFCNQNIIAGPGQDLPDAREIHDQVNHYLAFKGSRTSVQLAFFGGNFLGLDEDARQRLLNVAGDLIDLGKIDAIRFSTRPDTISRHTLHPLSRYPVAAVELGVQSMNDAVLSLSRRGHTANCTRDAAALLNEYGMTTGMQLMIGLPGDTCATAMESASAIADLHPAFVRIYPLIVFKGSLLHRWYLQGRYAPLSLDQSITLAKQMYLLFTGRNIPVIRMGLQATDLVEDDTSMVAGPWHPAFGHLVLCSIFLDRALELLRTSALPESAASVDLLVNPVSESRLRGNRNSNLAHLNGQYPHLTFRIRKDPSLAPDELRLTASYH